MKPSAQAQVFTGLAPDRRSLVASGFHRHPGSRRSDSGRFARSAIRRTGASRVEFAASATGPWQEEGGLVAATAAGCSLFPGREDSSLYLAQAADHARAGRFDEAIAGATRTLEIDPQSAQALTIRGAALYEKKEYDRALADLDRALKIDPKLAEAYYNRGNSYAALGDHARAIDDYTEALRFERSEWFEPRYNRVNSHRATHDYDRAVADYDRTLTTVPQFVPVLLGRGAAHQGAGRHAEAVADFTRALELQPAGKGITTPTAAGQ